MKLYISVIFVILPILFVYLYYKYYLILTLTKEEIDKIYNFGYITYDKESYKDIPTGYGEMTWDGIHQIADYIKKTDPTCKTFIDIGSGSGKLLTMAVATNFFQKVRGVEIVKERYDYSKEKLENLPWYIRNKINIKYGDLFQLNSDFFENNSVVFISNLLFPEELNSKLFEFLFANLRKNTYLIVSLADPLSRRAFMNKLKVPMTWLENSDCYIYKL